MHQFLQTTELNDYLSVTNQMIKIPSHEAYNLNLIKKCIKKFKLVLISCGCLKLKELKKLLKLAKFQNVILMHCVSSYPLELKNCNFKKLDYLKNLQIKLVIRVIFKGINDALFAIEKKAIIIEKHFTINNSLPGRDNKFALLPKDFVFK